LVLAKDKVTHYQIYIIIIRRRRRRRERGGSNQLTVGCPC